MPSLSHDWSVLIAAPAARIYEFLLDPVNRWTTDADVEVREVALTPEGVGMTTRTVFPAPVIGRFGVKESTRFAITGACRSGASSGRPRRRAPGWLSFPGTWAWTLTPDPGVTRLRPEDAELASPIVYVLDKLLQRSWNKETADWLQNTEAALEAEPISSSGGTDVLS